MNTIKDYFREFEKAEIVKSFFGEYPDLHDSEVIELRLNRELGFDFTGPKLYLTLYTFNSDVADTDPNRKESKLELLFENVEVEYIRDFNHQNAMDDFNMEKYFCERLKENRYRITFGQFGANVKFTCKTIHILSIEPYCPLNYFDK